MAIFLPSEFRHRPFGIIPSTAMKTGLHVDGRVFQGFCQVMRLALGKKKAITAMNGNGW
jgi:hypothetical protein